MDKGTRSIKNLEKTLNRLSLFLAISFVLSLVAISILANERLVYIWIAASLGIIGFIFLLVRYSKVSNPQEDCYFCEADK